MSNLIGSIIGRSLALFVFVVFMLVLGGCSLFQSAPESSIQAVSAACSMGKVKSLESIKAGERVSVICK